MGPSAGQPFTRNKTGGIASSRRVWWGRPTANECRLPAGCRLRPGFGFGLGFGFGSPLHTHTPPREPPTTGRPWPITRRPMPRRDAVQRSARQSTAMQRCSATRTRPHTSCHTARRKLLQGRWGAGGGGGTEAHFPTPNPFCPPCLEGGGGVGAGGALPAVPRAGGGGGGEGSAPMAQNDPHFELIILTTYAFFGGGDCCSGANIRCCTKQRAQHGSPFL